MSTRELYGIDAATERPFDSDSRIPALIRNGAQVASASLSFKMDGILMRHFSGTQKELFRRGG